jgi:hypothetical protein
MNDGAKRATDFLSDAKDSAALAQANENRHLLALADSI